MLSRVAARRSTPCLSVAVAGAWPRAQTAEEFFNSGAQFYISNNIPAALKKVEGGRKLYPDDVKLKKLEELLNSSSNNSNNSSNNQQQSQQNQQNQQQHQQNQQSQQNQQQSQNTKSAGSRNQQQQPANGSKTTKQDKQNGQTQAAAAREMSPEQAQRLLDAQKGDEQFLQLKPKNPPENQNKPIKDW